MVNALTCCKRIVLNPSSSTMFDDVADRVSGLASIYGSFIEGFDTAGPRDAKALLDELG
jgi:hypothetical protein